MESGKLEKCKSLLKRDLEDFDNLIAKMGDGNSQPLVEAVGNIVADIITDKKNHPLYFYDMLGSKKSGDYNSFASFIFREEISWSILFRLCLDSRCCRIDERRTVVYYTNDEATDTSEKLYQALLQDKQYGDYFARKTTAYNATSRGTEALHYFEVKYRDSIAKVIYNRVNDLG